MKLNRPSIYEEFDDGLGLSGIGSGGGQDSTPTEDGSQLGAADENASQQQSQLSLPGFDPNAFAQANAAALEQVLQRVVPQQQQRGMQDMSDEEFDQRTQKWRPDAAFVQAMFSPDATPEQRLEALNTMIDKITTHANLVAGLGLQLTQQQFEQRLTPLQQAQQAHQRSVFETKLTTSFPSLKNYMHFVPQAVHAVKASNIQFKSEDEAIKAVAHMCAALVKQVSPAGGAPNISASRNGMPAMATMTAGGSNPNAGGGKGKSQKPKWQSLFGAAS